MPRLRRLAFRSVPLLALSIGALTACALVLDIEPPVRATFACKGEARPDADQIFVAPAPVGSTAANCGPITLPCASVQLGIERARVLSKPIVYVARGTYVETISLSPGITVEGAWEVAGNEWTRSCVPPLHDAVVVRTPPDRDRTAIAIDVGGVARLRMLTMQSKGANETNAGESLYGLVAIGPTTHVELDDVVINVGPGGNGAPGAAGQNGEQGGADCDAGSGAAATVPGSEGPSADAGAFGDAGFVATIGGNGTIGARGENGNIGSESTCVTCVECTGDLTCVSNAMADSCGTTPPLRCGGGPGAGGAAGGSGGASVGVFAWDAVVSISGGSVTSGPGGRGALGGSGGAGGAGGIAAVGNDGPDCSGNCNAVAPCSGPKRHGNAGVAASGGNGSAGGNGGDGAGGPSFAIVQGGAATVTVSGTALAHGRAGTSDGKGPSGAAAERFP